MNRHSVTTQRNLSPILGQGNRKLASVHLSLRCFASSPLCVKSLIRTHVNSTQSRQVRKEKPQSRTIPGKRLVAGPTVGNEPVPGLQLQGAFAQAQFSLRKRNFNAGFAKQSFDAVIDVAANLGVQPRPVRPNEQTKVERPVAEFEELNFWRRIFQ